MLPDFRRIQYFFVYQYTFVDNLSFIHNPYDYYSDTPKQLVDLYVDEIRKVFIKNGWEKDGDIGLIWIPPFVDCGINNTIGTDIWHVKQYNNGISFLACEFPLEFSRLREQNEDPLPQGKCSHIPVSIIHTCVEAFTRQINEEKQKLKDMLTFLNATNDNKICDDILESIRYFSQNIIVRNLNEFFDECYLQFLIEAIDNGNPSNIKICKSQVRLSPSQYIPEEIFDDEDAVDSGKWFTLKGIVSDMWRAYKFEPFKNKMDMLFKTIDFELDKIKSQEIMKHVILRNCIQHHEGILDKDSFKQLGVSKVTMLDLNGIYEIQAGKHIYFSDSELFRLCDLLLEFAEAFNSFVNSKVHTRLFLSVK